MKHEKVAKDKIFYENDNQILNFNAMFVVKAQRGQSEIATDVLKIIAFNSRSWLNIELNQIQRPWSF